MYEGKLNVIKLVKVEDRFDSFVFFQFYEVSVVSEVFSANVTDHIAGKTFVNIT